MNQLCVLCKHNNVKEIKERLLPESLSLKGLHYFVDNVNITLYTVLVIGPPSGIFLQEQ
jgi:hypothetical protein